MTTCRTTRARSSCSGSKVAYADLAPGDVVFFGSPIHHVGMYIGGGYFLHAPRTGDFVKITKLAGRAATSQVPAATRGRTASALPSRP